MHEGKGLTHKKYAYTQTKYILCPAHSKLLFLEILSKSR